MLGLTLDTVFLHSCEFLEGETEGIYHEYCLGCIYPVTFVHLDSYDEQDEEYQEA